MTLDDPYTVFLPFMTLIQSYDPSWPLHSLMTLDDPYTVFWPFMTLIHSHDPWWPLYSLMTLDDPYTVSWPLMTLIQAYDHWWPLYSLMTLDDPYTYTIQSHDPWWPLYSLMTLDDPYVSWLLQTKVSRVLNCLRSGTVNSENQKNGSREPCCSEYPVLYGRSILFESNCTHHEI